MPLKNELAFLAALPLVLRDVDPSRIFKVSFSVELIALLLLLHPSTASFLLPYPPILVTEPISDHLYPLYPSHRPQRVEKIGKGAFGSVYKALHIPTSFVVALKIIDLDTQDDDTADIQREVGMLQSMTRNGDAEKSNVTRYFGCWMEGPKVWIAMDYAGGGSLKTLVSFGVALSLSLAEDSVVGADLDEGREGGEKEKETSSELACFAVGEELSSLPKLVRVHEALPTSTRSSSEGLVWCRIEGESAWGPGAGRKQRRR